MAFTTLRRVFGSLSHPRRTPRRPALEALEDRSLLAADPFSPFVASAYYMLLNRAPDADGLAYWAAQAQSVGTDGVLRGIMASPEHRRVEVGNLYTTLLGRTADPAGLGYWSAFADDEAKAGLLGSDEFFGRVGHSSDRFLNAVYLNDLGRPLDDGGRQYWGGLLAGGAGRGDVAAQILESPEAVAASVRGAYSLYLGRPADAGGLDYWSGQIAADPWSSPDDVLLAGLLGSGEGVSRMSDFLGYGMGASDGWGWSDGGFDPWLPVSYAQTPEGWSDWSSALGGSYDDSAFWASIGTGYGFDAYDRPVTTYNDAGWWTTSDTASSVRDYGDGYRIRTFPVEYLDSWGGYSSGGYDSLGSGDYGGKKSFGYDDNAVKSLVSGSYPSSSGGSGGSYSSWDNWGGYVNPYGNGTDLWGGYEVPQFQYPTTSNWVDL